VSETGGTVADVLARRPEVTLHLDQASIELLTDPANFFRHGAEDGGRAIAASQQQGARS
jgi:3-carboxy-cis,cis-muconate cycloisomerase